MGIVLCVNYLPRLLGVIEYVVFMFIFYLMFVRYVNYFFPPFGGG
jgi:hypothetical protein